ncbi:hypothetical protein WMF04_50875 [Sorangium sp. So ce260]|uniref:hypothetical protein n=1 Tax=Sorangium sp. So ce260 TaxID=3133291 RepID=UPI003F612CFE
MPSGIRLTRGALLAQRPERPSRRSAIAARARALPAAGALALAAAAGPAAAEELPPQLAYAYGENETPRSAALGGALRALGNGTSAVFLNPSAMVETRVYHLQALFQGSPEAGRHAYGGVVVDSVTGNLAGAISFVGGFVDMGEGGLRRSYIDARVGLAYPITDRLFVGVTGRYAKITQDGTLGERWLDNGPVSGGLRDPEEVNEQGDVDGRHAFVNELTFDAALTVKATDNLYIAAVGQNLSYPDHGLLPTTVGGGIGFGTDDFSIEVDGLADLNSYRDITYRLMAGGEYLVADRFPLRAGYRFDQGADQHALSLGAAYVGTQFAVEGTVRRALAGGGPTTFVVGLSYHLESSGLTRASSDGL